MEVTVAGPIKKRKYEYKTINLNKTGLKGWELATRWGNNDPIKDVDMDEKGNIFIAVRRPLKS